MARYRIQRIVQGPRLVSTLGTRRRVRALARRGWGHAEVSRSIGMDRWAFSKVVCQTEVRREVAEKVRAVYPELAFREGPNHLARCNAERKGWPGPMDWDDPDNPDEIPACEIEAAHREALAMDRAWRKNHQRRKARRSGAPGQRVVELRRQSGGTEEADRQQEVAMAT
jgi:hypothetical protein